jgi:hypothetical protein
MFLKIDGSKFDFSKVDWWADKSLTEQMGWTFGEVLIGAIIVGIIGFFVTYVILASRCPHEWGEWEERAGYMEVRKCKKCGGSQSRYFGL